MTTRLFHLSAAALLALSSCKKPDEAGRAAQPATTPPPAAPSQPAPVAKPETAEEAPFLVDVDAKAAAALLAEQPAPVVLDVRTPEEFAAGHIEGAVNIDFNGAAFKEELAKLDKDKTYLLHCRSGGRSGQAKPLFTELGFKSVYHLDGGLLAWEKDSLPTVK